MQSVLGTNPFKYSRGADVWPPLAGFFRAGFHAFTYTIPPEISGPQFFQWYLNDPEYAIQTLYRRRVLIDWAKVRETARAGVIQGLWQVAVMMSLRGVADYKYGADPQDLIAAKVNSTRDFLFPLSTSTPVAAQGSKAAIEIGSAASSVVTTVLDTKFLWMNATFAWERAVKDFSYSIFFGFAASVVSLGYGFRYQLSKGVYVDPADRDWKKLFTDYIELLFFFAGQAIGSAATAGVAFLVVPFPTLVVMTVWLPKIFIGRASGASFQNFSRAYITRTASKSITAAQQ